MDNRRADEVIADAQARTVPSPTRRGVRLPGLPGKADAVIGMRRTGKTWLLFQDMQERLAAGARREQLLYVNFEDERLMGLVAGDLGDLLDALYRRAPWVRDEGAFLYWDEIQNVPGWEPFIRRVLDEDHGRVVVTGSSAKLLSKEIGTSLRGRSLATEVLPFSFEEALRHAEHVLPDRWPPSERQRHALRHAFDRYLEIGGFPEVQRLDEPLRVRVLQDYVDAVLLRDVIERHAVSNPTALRALARRLLASPAGRFAMHRFYNDLKSRGVRVSKDTLYALLAHLEDAFLVHAVSIDSASERVRSTNPRKMYPNDPGLARAHAFGAARDLGHLLETLVYLELRRRGYRMSYLLTTAGHEVDFIARRAQDDAPRLVQVCLSLADPQTCDREVRALAAAMAERDVDQAEIVSLDAGDGAPIACAAGTIHVHAAWSWLLHDALDPGQPAAFVSS